MFEGPWTGYLARGRVNFVASMKFLLSTNVAPGVVNTRSIKSIKEDGDVMCVMLSGITRTSMAASLTAHNLAAHRAK